MARSGRGVEFDVTGHPFEGAVRSEGWFISQEAEYSIAATLPPSQQGPVGQSQWVGPLGTDGVAHEVKLAWPVVRSAIPALSG